MIRIIALASTWALMLGSAWAIDPESPFEDPQLEAQYQALIDEVRCLVCQNQTIADSNAPLAADLRREIREMMGEGASRERSGGILGCPLWRIRSVPASLPAVHMGVVGRPGVFRDPRDGGFCAHPAGANGATA